VGYLEELHGKEGDPHSLGCVGYKGKLWLGIMSFVCSQLVIYLHNIIVYDLCVIMLD
jgi:hypothetical protein